MAFSLSFGGVACAIPPRSFDINIDEVETVQKSEAGTDLSYVTRLNKHIFKIGWKGVDSAFVDSIEALARQTTVAVGFRGNTYTCRIRKFSPKFIAYSEGVPGTDGIWDVSITATEV